MPAFREFDYHRLSDDCGLYVGMLPPELRFSAEEFNLLWNQRPTEFHEIMIHGKRVKTPRWQQAYGRDYHYTGCRNAALPLLPQLDPLLTYVQRQIDDRLNGVLLNWYDGDLRHYIGKHRDSITNTIEGAPIVTISLGAKRTFRVRPWRTPGRVDFDACDGSVFVMPWTTNRSFTHEVPHFAHNAGERISITFRAFEQDEESNGRPFRGGERMAK